MSFKDYITYEFDVAMAVQEEAAAAVDYDLYTNNVSECLFSPATESLTEDMEVLCMEHMHVLASLEEKHQTALEAYGDEVVVESFKESVKKYWERFKAFIIKIKNLVVRTVQRVIAYIKTLIMRLAAKVVAKLRGKDAKKMAKEVEKGSRFVKKIEVRPNLSKSVDELCDDYMEALVAVTNKASSVAIPEAGSSEKQIDDAKDKLEAIYDEHQKSKSELLDEVLGEAKEVSVTEISGLEEAYNAIKKAKVPKAVDNVKKQILKVIDKVEKDATKKSKSISSKRIAFYTYSTNHAVQQMNAILAAIQETYVLWLSARIKVVNAYYNASEEKEEDEDDEDVDKPVAKPEDKPVDNKPVKTVKSILQKERENLIDDEKPINKNSKLYKALEKRRKEKANQKIFSQYTDQEEVEPGDAF